MKRCLVLFSLFVIGAVAPRVQSQGRGANPEREAAIAKQLALEAATPKLQVTEEVLPLMIPGHTLGETMGVSMNSKGHLFIYTRSGYGGISGGPTAARRFAVAQTVTFG